MIDIARHDTDIKNFLNDLNVQEKLFEFTSSNSKDLIQLLCDMKWSKEKMLSQNYIARQIGVFPENIRDTVKQDTNFALNCLSEYCNIDPPIQLYFRTDNINCVGKSIKTGYSNIGAHLACCEKGMSAGSSGRFVAEDKLRDMLNQAREQLIGQPKLKYLRNMKEVLRYSDNNVTSQWFRKTGPIEIDFTECKVYPRTKTLESLHKHIFDNAISILDGEAGSGKSVLIRHIAYNSIKNHNQVQFFYYSFKDSLPILDFRDFIDDLDNVKGVVLIEDIHLSTPSMQLVQDQLKLTSNKHILLTTRPSFRKNMLSQYPKGLGDLPIFSLQHRSDSKEIAKYYIQHNRKEDFSNFNCDTNYIGDENLWYLSYALEGHLDQGDPYDWIGRGVRMDLEDMQKLKCKPQILIALAPLYMNELLTSQAFLVTCLGFDEADINMLIERNEIIEHVDGETDEIYYGLPHSTIASAYWTYGKRYRKLLKISDYNEIVANYAASGTINGLRAIRTTTNTIQIQILHQLLIHNAALSAFQCERERGPYFELVRQLAHLLKHSDNRDLYPDSFITGLTEVLFDRKWFAELTLFIIPFLQLPNSIGIFSEYFLTNLYQYDCFGDACRFLSLLGGIKRADALDFSTRIDYLKLASIVDPIKSYPYQVATSIRYLLRINHELATNFCLEICNRLPRRENFVKEWINEIYLCYKALSKTYDLVYTDNSNMKQLCDRLVDIEDDISDASYGAIFTFSVQLSVLDYLFQVNRDIGIDYWNRLNKVFILGSNVKHFDGHCSALLNTTKLDDTIASDLRNVIDLNLLLTKAEMTDDCNALLKGMIDLYEIHEEIGFDFIDALENDIFTRKIRGDLIASCQLLKDASKLDMRFVSKLCNLIFPQGTVLKYHHSDNDSIFMEVLTSLLKIDKSLGLKFWNSIDKEHMINDIGTPISFLCSCLIYASYPEIKVELSEIISTEQLVAKFYHEDNVASITLLISCIYDINKSKSDDLLKGLNKTDYSRLLLQSEAQDILTSIMHLHDKYPHFADDLWINYFNTSEVANKVLQGFSEFPLMPEYIYLLNESSPKYAKELISYFDTSQVIKSFPTYMQEDRKVRMLSFFALNGLPITTEYRCAVSEWIGGYANTLISDGYGGWNTNNQIVGIEPIAANILYNCIYDSIGVDCFIDHLKKSDSNDVLVKCSEFFKLVDPEDEKGWTKYMKCIGNQ